MREILFRGKRISDGAWVYGCLFVDDKQEKCEILCGYTNYRLAWEVDPTTVGQFTGLTANSKKIFEGDVIRFHKYRGEPDWVGVVKYEHCLYMAVGRMPLAYEKRIGEEPYFCPFEVQISSIDKTTINVIGNIHDNPELLEEA